MTSTVLPTLAGMALLAVVTVDIIGTILHSWMGMGPVARRVVAGLWWGVRQVERRVGNEQRTRRVAGWVAPFLVPVLILVWVGLGVMGYALIYLPQMPDGFHTGRPVPAPATLLDAFYYSAVTLFTLGYGAVIPISPTTRLIAISEAAWGFAVVSMITSYYVNLTGADSQQKALGQALYLQAGGSAEAARIVIHHLCTGDGRTLVDQVARSRDALVRTGIALQSYTTLYYIRPPRPEVSYLRILFVLHEMAQVLDCMLCPRATPQLAGSGGRLGLRAALERARADLLHGLRCTATQRLDIYDPALEQACRERCRRTAATLRAAGIAVRPDEEAVEEYCRSAAACEMDLRAAAAVVGEPWDEVRGC